MNRTAFPAVLFVDHLAANRAWFYGVAEFELCAGASTGFASPAF